MKITLESTTKIVELNGVPARIWEGKTATGTPVICLVTRVAVAADLPQEVHDQFTDELQECVPPSAEPAAWPARMAL